MAKKKKYINGSDSALSYLFPEEDDTFNENIQYDSNSVRSVLQETSGPDTDTDHAQVEKDVIDDEKLKLVPGQTLIGTRVVIDSKNSDQPRMIKVYYGNYIDPPMRTADGLHYIPMKEEKYREILNTFLDSEEGRDYERPTEEEMAAASAEVVEVVENHFEQEQRDEAAGMIQPGRQPAAKKTSEEEEPIQEDEKGQTKESDGVKFADDMPSEEEKAIEFIKNKKYTRQQIKEIRKGLESEKRRSTLGTIAIAVISVAILGFTIFLIKDLIVRAHAIIELELKQNSITIRSGDAFNPSDYVKYVTEDENVYIIYPSLDTEDVGEHSLDFVATNGIKNVRKTMIVNVIDGDSPTIVLTDEEIKLVRNRDEETFDALKYVKEVHDNIDADEDLYVEVNPIDWEKDEQSLSYRVKDSSGNAGKAVLLVKIEDKAICDKNAVYNSASNTCSCKSGYSGDGFACKLVQSSSSGTASSGNSGGGGSSSSGNSSGSSSSSSSSSSESYTIDYEDYQPGNGQYDVTITDNNTGESTTVTTEDPPMPGASDDEFFDWINDQLP